MPTKKVSCNKLQITSLRSDHYLESFFPDLDRRRAKTLAMRKLLTGRSNGSLVSKAASEHLFFGLHRQKDGSWIFREWAPNASRIFLVGDFSNFEEKSAFELQKLSSPHGCWEIKLAPEQLRSGMHYCLHIYFADGTMGVRLPAYAKYVVIDIDGNGTAEKKDANTIIQYIVGANDSVNDSTALDVNSDGKVTVVDAIMLLLYLAGKR